MRPWIDKRRRGASSKGGAPIIISYSYYNPITCRRAYLFATIMCHPNAHCTQRAERFIIRSCKVGQSLKLPKRLSPLIFGVIQSCLTCAAAAAVAHSTDSLSVWLKAWLWSWMIILPIVLLAAPVIRKIVSYLTGERTQ